MKFIKVKGIIFETTGLIISKGKDSIIILKYAMLTIDAEFDTEEERDIEFDRLEKLLVGETIKSIDENSNIEILVLSNRVLKALRDEGINTVKDLLQLSEYDIRGIPHMGRISHSEINNSLRRHGLSLKLEG